MRTNAFYLTADASDAGNEHVCGTYDSNGDDIEADGSGNGKPRQVREKRGVNKLCDESFQQAAEQVPHVGATEQQVKVQLLDLWR